MDPNFKNNLTIAYLNIHGQSGLLIPKQKQLEDFLRRNEIDVLHCQEINIDDDTFSQCHFLLSNYSVIKNNSLNKYGTATVIRNEFNPENIKLDTCGKAIFFDLFNLTLGNVYLQSGTDGQSRGLRENFCSEIIPQMLLNCQDHGVMGGDFNCITRAVDCTNNPEAKMSPCLKRLEKTFSLNDSYRAIHPVTETFSRYYSRGGGEIGASRIDRSYHWGDITVEEAGYSSIAFSDHMAHILKIILPENAGYNCSPRSRPFFKTSPEVVMDETFKKRLKSEMIGWKEVKERGLPLMSWWEVVVKPGIRRLAINRSKEINRERRSELNCLLLKQSYYSRELMHGDRDCLGNLLDIKSQIKDWYDRESKKVVLQSKVDDCQESEKVRIFHHEQHKKHIKRSSILKLQTSQGMMDGHSACSNFLQGEVAKLLLTPVVLDEAAQAVLLAEVKPVFTEADNTKLKQPPSKSRTYEVLSKSNLNAAPGTDGITSLLYKEHWDVLGDSLHQVVTAVHEGARLTKSQRTSLMVFGAKPKKPLSLKPEDKRRISLLNSDFKLSTALEADSFKDTYTHTLSPFQLVAGSDRRIHHGINKARDCIQAVAKSKVGCALVDVDFIAAFDLTVFNWVLMVLRAKGLCEEVIMRLENIYSDTITIPVINNIPGSPLSNVRGSLRQGCPGSMGWFAVGIDPLIQYLHNRLQGIRICAIPVLGPLLEGEKAAPQIEERYKVYGLADDIKASISTMAEFTVLEDAATLFEKSSGNQLHRDRLNGKCKVLALGRWRNTLQQEDISQQHFRLSDTLSMVGVDLMASWQQTRKLNNDELIRRVKTTISAWKSGKFVPLVSRPFSLNSYCLSKVWFRTHTVDLRAGDINTISGACKSWAYQDMLEKPHELLLYRPTDEGGLGLHHVRSKALAGLIATFLQTAANPNFQQSLFHNLLYRQNCLNDQTTPQVPPPPYYSREFFDTIKEVVEKTPLNPIAMSVKQWYQYLLEKNVTMEVFDDEGRMMKKLSKVEERNPQNDWNKIFHLARLKGLTPEIKSFNFKLLHGILPCKERLSQLLPNVSATCCLCYDEQPESINHIFFQCRASSEASQYLLNLVQVYDSSVSRDNMIMLNISTDILYELPVILILCTGLQLIWKKRVEKKSTSLHETRAELECLVSTLRRSRSKRLREAAKMLENTLINFSVV